MPRLTYTTRKARLLQTALACLLVAASVLSLASATIQASPNLANVRTASPNGLVINEVYESQTESSEYFELYNGGTGTVDLTNYVIASSTGETSLSRLTDLTIGPGEFRVIGPSQLMTGTIAGTGLERTDYLGLVTTSPSDSVIDVVNFGGSPNPSWYRYDTFASFYFTANIPPLPAQDGQFSLQRWPDGVDTDQGNDFVNNITSSPGTASCGDPFENDNSLSAAKEQAIDSEVLHRLCPAGDQDFISFQASTSFTYTLQTINVGASVDTVIQLYDSSNTQIAFDDNPARRDSTLAFRPASSGLHKARVTHKTGAGNNGFNYLYTFKISATSTSLTPTPTAGPSTGCADVFEPDNALTQARFIELNTEQTHKLCRDGVANRADEDWVKFSVSSGKVYTFFTDDLTDNVDTIIALYTGNGNKLAENDDASPGQGLESRIEYTFGSGGEYYLRVRDARGLGSPSYQYNVGISTVGALPPTRTASPTASPNPNSPTPTASPCNDTYEPDGVPENASLILIGSSQRHIICPATDADWVRFYARAGKVYTIRTANLGVGLDTYMFLFESNASTIIAQNDDGGVDGVASSIDFYPLRDDFYFVQVKNAGDIGGSQQTYDLTLEVQPGVPQPPSTASPGAATAPPRTTPATQQVIPPTAVPPTRAPINTPTQGVVPPTPAVAQPTLPPPVGTGEVPPANTPTRAAQPPTNTVQPQQAPQPQPTGVATLPVANTPPPTQASVPATSGPVFPVGPTATVFIPKVPKTGGQKVGVEEDMPAKNSAPVAKKEKAPAEKPPVEPQAPEPPANPAPAPNLAPMRFRVFYDSNRNDKFDAGEGVRGMTVFFLPTDSSVAEYGRIVTADEGVGATGLPVKGHKVYVPYLGINVELRGFPGREMHQLWLPPVQLPDRVP